VAAAVAPIGNLFVRKTGQSAGRIGECVANGLRPGNHHRAVGRVSSEESAEGVVCPQFRGGQLSGRWIQTVRNPWRAVLGKRLTYP
jgi:hypothetical protein